MTSLKRKIGVIYVKMRLRSDRGETLLSIPNSLINAGQKGGILILLISTYFDFLVPIWIVVILYIGHKVAEYTLGWYDEKHLKFWHLESEYTQRNVNPYYQELMQRVKNIEEALEKINA